MAPTSLSDALRPLATHMPRAVREREILRVAATLGKNGSEQDAAKARKEILKWAQRRVGAHLPEAAWKYDEFEKRMGGRDCKAVRVVDGITDLWAIRANDPDKTIAQRVWTTEIVIGLDKSENARFGLRLLASAPEMDSLPIEPAVPGLLRQLARECELYQGTRSLVSEPWVIGSDDDIERLIDTLLDQSRREPVFVLSVPPESADPSAPLMGAEPLAHAMLGLAMIIVLPACFTWVLTDRLGKRLSVFGGAARVYMSGFTEDADPYGHALFLAERLSSPKSAREVSVALRQIAVAESLRRFRLGHDVLSFSAVQNLSLAAESIHLERENATAEKKLVAARTEIENLKESLKKSEDEKDWFAEQHSDEEKKAKELEQKLKIANLRIQNLTEQLATHDDKPDSNVSLPDKWEDFSDWCEDHLSDRVVLSPRARREVKAPAFEDVGMAARCLIWLANDYRQARLQGTGSLRVSIESGLKNDRCGNDKFQFKWKRKRIDVEWHVKNGGNTRNPARCLRIYYFWYEADEQVVIASMPAHIRTGAT